jgi:hypothetical protein
VYVFFRLSQQDLIDMRWFAVVEHQYQEIISASDAWVIADEDQDDILARDVRATNSARRTRALVNQITGKRLLSSAQSHPREGY